MNGRTLTFLDVDGVLNRDRWYEEHPDADKHWPEMHLDPVLCARVQAALPPETELVLSSTWRKLLNLEDLGVLLTERGLTAPLVGHTPVMWAAENAHVVGDTPWRQIGRGLEIQWWLRTFVPDLAAARVAVLDDDADMGQMMPWLVRTNTQLGFLPKQAFRLQKVLSKPMGGVRWRLNALAGVLDERYPPVCL
jgi:hypothetical protein